MKVKKDNPLLKETKVIKPSKTKKPKKVSASKREIKKKRLAEWANLLKDDQDWDYIYILTILKYKLERTRKCILSNGIIADAKSVASEIKEVEELLDKVIKDDYINDFTKDFRKKHGSLKMTLDEKNATKHGIPAKFRFTKDNKKNRSILFVNWRKLTVKAGRARVDDLKRAFDLTAENIWGWWD